MLTWTEDRVGSSATSMMVPCRPVKRPLTVENIMWRTPNSTRLWDGSICQGGVVWVGGAEVRLMAWRPSLERTLRHSTMYSMDSWSVKPSWRHARGEHTSRSIGSCEHR